MSSPRLSFLCAAGALLWMPSVLRSEAAAISPADLAATPAAKDEALGKSESSGQANAQPAVAAAGKRSLKVGMPAAELQALIGKPQEVSPMGNTEAGPAEIWIYRRLKETKTDQVHMGDKQITQPYVDATGRRIENVVATEAIYKTRRKDTYEVLQLLLVNGLYVNMKKSVEVKDSYE